MKHDESAGPCALPDRFGNYAETVRILVMLPAVLALTLRLNTFFGANARWEVLLLSCVFLIGAQVVINARSMQFSIPASVGFINSAILGFGFFLVLAALVGNSLHLGAPLLFGSFFIPAFVEEIIFRVSLPARLKEKFSRSSHPERRFQPLPALISQFSFAVCHLVAEPPHQLAAAALTTVRLFIAGCLLYSLVASVGVWWAAATHATLNFELATHVGGALRSTHTLYLAGLAAIAIFAVHTVSSARTKDAVLGRTLHDASNLPTNGG